MCWCVCVFICVHVCVYVHTYMRVSVSINFMVITLCVFVFDVNARFNTATTQ